MQLVNARDAVQPKRHVPSASSPASSQPSDRMNATSSGVISASGSALAWTPFPLWLPLLAEALAGSSRPAGVRPPGLTDFAVPFASGCASRLPLLLGDSGSAAEAPSEAVELACAKSESVQGVGATVLAHGICQILLGWP